MIYLDYGASAPQRPEVTEKMVALMGSLRGNPGAVHQAGGEARGVLQESRRILARLLGVQDREIYFTSGGTESNNWAIRCGCPAGKRIVVAASEHASVLRAAQAMQQLGHPLTLVQPDSAGRIVPEQVAQALGPDAGLLCVQGANNETGVIQDVDALAALAKDRQILFHCDAVQSFGRIRQNLCRADLISLSAHKLGGPVGVGCLVIRYPHRLPPLLLGGGQELGLRSGTENVIGAAGFALAAQLCRDQLETEQQRLKDLEQLLLGSLHTAGVDPAVNGGEAPRVPGVLSCRFSGISAEELVMRLDLRGICVSAGAACAARDAAPSHVLLSMGLTAQQARQSVRISMGCATTRQEILCTAAAIAEILKKC